MAKSGWLAMKAARLEYESIIDRTVLAYYVQSLERSDCDVTQVYDPRIGRIGGSMQVT
jgi:hypothetical protein